MILVFFILLICVIFLMLLKIELNIVNFKIDNEQKLFYNKDILIKISFKILKFNFITIKLDYNKLMKLYINGKKKNLNKFKNKQNKKDAMNLLKNKKVLQELKKINFRLEKLNLDIKIGLSDCIATVYSVTFISSIISIILSYVANKNISNYKYNIYPIFSNKFSYKINLNCIINAKLVHIIYMIFLIRKGRSDKNERTSNRKSYDYSYE